MTIPGGYDEAESVWMGLRYAIWKGQRVRVMTYDHDGLFWCLDRDDARRLLHRDELTFVKPKRKTT